MAVVKRVVTEHLCDVGGDPHVATVRIEVSVDGKPRELDLCDAHAAPLVDLWAKGRKVPRGRRAIARSDAADVVVEPARDDPPPAWAEEALRATQRPYPPSPRHTPTIET